MNVSELMTYPVRTCRPDDSCATAAQHMWDGDCGCVIVTDDHDRLAGVVTDRDLCMATFTTGRPLDAIPVAHAMGAPVRTCRPEDSLATALNAFGTHQLHRLPVLDQSGKLVGLIGLSDIARHAAAKGDTGELTNAVLRAIAKVKLARTPAPPPERTVAIPPAAATAARATAQPQASPAPRTAAPEPAKKTAAAPSTKSSAAPPTNPKAPAKTDAGPPAKAAPASDQPTATGKSPSTKASAPPKTGGTGSSKPRNKR